MIQFTCECGRALKIKPEFAGKKVRCPDCQAVQRVPTGDEPSPAVPEGPSLTDRAADIGDKAASALKGFGSMIAAAIPRRDALAPPTELVPQMPSVITTSNATLDRLTAQRQDPATVSKVLDRVESILTSNEQLECIAVQQRPLINLSPDCVVLTNRRVILYRPKLLGRVDMEDHIWRDLRNAKLTENIIGATLSFEHVDGTVIAVDYIPKEQARFLYRYAQEREEAVRNERRDRRMEEDRAKAGGVHILQSIGAAAPSTSSPRSDPMQKLQQLKQLLDASMLTQAEYDLKRSEIIAQL